MRTCRDARVVVSRAETSRSASPERPVVAIGFETRWRKNKMARVRSARRSTTRAALPEEAGQAKQEHERHDDIAPDGARERVKAFHVTRRHGVLGANLVVKLSRTC